MKSKNHLSRALADQINLIERVHQKRQELIFFEKDTLLADDPANQQFSYMKAILNEVEGQGRGTAKIAVKLEENQQAALDRQRLILNDIHNWKVCIKSSSLNHYKKMR